MSLVDVKVPDIGDFTDVPVIEVLVKPGDTVKPEDALVTLESDKATMDVPSPAAGTVKSIAVKVGDKVSEGSLLLMLEAADAVAVSAPAPVAAPAAAAPAAPAPVAAPAAASFAGNADLDCDVLVLGAGRNALRFAPPLVLSRDQADEVLRVFDEALTEVGGGSVGPAGRV